MTTTAKTGSDARRTRRQTRKQPALASRAMVTSNHRLASLAGTEILARGGNAVDAAIATMFALSVVEPMMTTIFGAGFITIRLADGTTTTIDNYATVPAAATPDMFEPIPDSLDNDVVDGLNSSGHLAVATGGSLLGWATAVDRYGTLPLPTVVAPAVRYAREGFQVSPYLHEIITMQQAELARFPATAEIFLPDGDPAPIGSWIRRVDYGNTLERVGEDGPGLLYGGDLGQAIVAEMERHGGILTLDDLTSYQVFERPPVTGSYRGYDVISMAPPSSGGTHIIQMLNILEGFDLHELGFGSPDYIHLVAEAMKIAFADRFRYMADPTTTEVPVEWLASKEYAAARRSQIDLARSQQWSPGVAPDGEGSSTTHCCVVDEAGNVVTTTQTLNGGFGSKVTVPGTGMLLNNCMHLMDPTPGRTNSIAPNKRILSSMSPTIVSRDGRLVLALGTPGGVRIFGSVLQGILNVIDHGMTLQEAVEAPRLWDRGPELELETGFDDLPELSEELQRRGHEVKHVFRVAGGMNGIMIHPALACSKGLLAGVPTARQWAFRAGKPHCRLATSRRCGPNWAALVTQA